MSYEKGHSMRKVISTITGSAVLVFGLLAGAGSATATSATIEVTTPPDVRISIDGTSSAIPLSGLWDWT